MVKEATWVAREASVAMAVAMVVAKALEATKVVQSHSIRLKAATALSFLGLQSPTLKGRVAKGERD